MSRVRLPLYGKILSWFALNLAVLALLFFFFLKAQFRLGLDWMLSGEPGDRIAAIGETITFEFSRLAESEWPAHLSDYDQKHGVTFGLLTDAASSSMANRSRHRPRSCRDSSTAVHSEKNSPAAHPALSRNVLPMHRRSRAS
ncbi:MAG: hypothetical protein IPK32_16425 [Verrucomicrobiaceae bacterium]|nr:hypothetical protein [Verrucomicrobiaceae bacterium]